MRIKLNFDTGFQVFPYNPLKLISIYIVCYIIPAVLYKEHAIDRDAFDVITPNSMREIPFFSNNLTQIRKPLLVFTFSLGVYGYNFTNSSFRYQLSLLTFT